MSEPQKPLTKFNPSEEEKNLNASAIVVQMILMEGKFYTSTEATKITHCSQLV